MPVEHDALIVRDPNVCHGQATIKGTRVMVSVVLDALADGMTESEIIAEYPTLTVEGVRAAAAYGAELARDEYPAVSASWGSSSTRACRSRFWIDCPRRARTWTPPRPLLT